MADVKSVKIDGESIYMFKSAIYIFESRTGFSLVLDMIVSEIVENKYKNEENLILEIELEDGRLFNTIMHIQGLPGGLPQLSLYTNVDHIEEYGDFHVVNENDVNFPRIDEGITIEDIRKVEMPDVQVKLTLTLPIDQYEWINGKKKKELNEIFKEAIYEFWKKQTSE